MKKTVLCILMTMVFSAVLTGCRMGGSQDTTVNTTEAATQNTQSTEMPTSSEIQSGVSATTSAQILENIWASYEDSQRFAAYGGTMENPVDGAPGDLDISNTDEITTKYMIPEESLSAVTEGASLVHLMNGNIFTSGVFRLQENLDVPSIAKVIRGNIQKNQWICGSPDRLLIAQPESDFLLIAFGSEETMQTLQSKLSIVYPDSQILYSEAIVS